VLVTGVVRDPEHPTAESGLEIDWMVGATSRTLTRRGGTPGATLGGRDACSAAQGRPHIGNGPPTSGALVDLAARAGANPVADRAATQLRAIARTGDLHAVPESTGAS